MNLLEMNLIPMRTKFKLGNGKMALFKKTVDEEGHEEEHPFVIKAVCMENMVSDGTDFSVGEEISFTDGGRYLFDDQSELDVVAVSKPGRDRTFSVGDRVTAMGFARSTEGHEAFRFNSGHDSPNSRCTVKESLGNGFYIASWDAWAGPREFEIHADNLRKVRN